MFEVFRMFFQCFAWFWAGKQLRKDLEQGTVKVKFFRDVPVPAKHSLVVVLGFPLGIFCMFTCFGPSESRTRPRNRWHVCWRYVVICGDVIIKTTMKNIPSSTCWCVIKVNQRHWNIRVYDIWCTLGHGMIITGMAYGDWCNYHSTPPVRSPYPRVVLHRRPTSSGPRNSYKISLMTPHEVLYPQ